jgi:hypothetical protein
MKNEPENLTAQESLDIITAMIRQAKGNVQQSSFYFLLWGWTIVIANLGVYFLIRFTDVPNPFMMFAVTILAAIISAVYGFRQSNRMVTPPTILNNIYKWLWIGFGVNCFIFWIFGQQIGWQLNPVIITLCGVPTLISGIMLRFKPLILGGLTFWIFGSLIFLVDRETQFLLAALAMIVGYLVPGYMLRKSKG